MYYLYSSTIYITASVVYDNYSGILKTSKRVDINCFDLKLIERKVAEAYRNFIESRIGKCPKDVKINTVFKRKIEDVLYHMVTFIYVYHCFSTYHGLRLVMPVDGSVVEQVKNHPYKIFGISQSDIAIIEDSVENQELFYSKFIIKKNRKKRELIKYSDQKEGDEIRRIHQKMVECLGELYTASSASFAYKKGGSIKECVIKHKDNNSFLKYDISKFFNSISLDILQKEIEKIFSIDRKYAEITKTILKSVFICNGIPLGLVISPLLSDIYLQEIDNIFYEYAVENGYTYTRYADDIMISKKTQFESNEVNDIEEKLKNLLKQKKLCLNEKKKRYVDFQQSGQHIRYVGVNIVCGENKNYLSVGKRYIYEVAKEYLHYKELDSSDESQTKFYQARRIAGKVGFIKQIEGQRGWGKLQKRLEYNEDYFENNNLKL